MLARSKREGWTRQNCEAKALAVPSPGSGVSVPMAAAMSRAERGQRHVERMAGLMEKTLPHVERMEPWEIFDRIEDVDRLDKVARRTYGLDDQRSGSVRIAVSGGSACIDVVDIEASVEPIEPGATGTP